MIEEVRRVNTRMLENINWYLPNKLEEPKIPCTTTLQDLLHIVDNRVFRL
jgi:hypothetical protein